MKTMKTMKTRLKTEQIAMFERGNSSNQHPRLFLGLTANYSFSQTTIIKCRAWGCINPIIAA